jgi:hypothetical protein
MRTFHQLAISSIVREFRGDRRIVATLLTVRFVQNESD